MSLLLVLIIGGWLLYRLDTPGISKIMVLGGWGLKLMAGFLFIVIYTYYYGWGNLTADPQAFLDESGYLTSVASESIGDYFRFLFGFETKEQVIHYLSNTSHWSSGDLSIINDSQNLVRMNSLIYFFSGGNMYTHVAVFSWFSLIGFRELYLFLHYRSSMRASLIWWLLILIPSIAFWTGSNLKEPLMMVGICLLVRAFFDDRLQGWGKWGRCVFGVLLMLAFKPYVLVAFGLAVVAFEIGKRLPLRYQLYSPLSVITCLVVLLFCFHSLQQKTIHYLTRKQFDFINVGKGGLHAYADTCFYYFEPSQYASLSFSDNDFVELQRPITAKKVKLGKAHPFEDVYLTPNNHPWKIYYISESCSSYVPITFIDNSYTTLFLMIPEALVNTLFRPFIGDPGGPIKYAAMVETWGVFLFFLFQLRNWKRADERVKLMIVSLLFFVFLLGLIIGWITPVLGAIVRYRIPIYLAVAISSILLYKQHKKTI